MSEQQITHPEAARADSGLPSATTGTSDAERIAALEADVAALSMDLSDARNALRLLMYGVMEIPDLFESDAYREAEATIGQWDVARPAGTAAARVIDPERDRAAFEAALSTWNHHERLVKGSTAARFFFDAALAYARESRS